MQISRKYMLSYSIFTAVVAAALFCWNRFAPPAYTHALSWPLLAFFVIVYFGGHMFMIGASGQKPAVFVRRFMATTTVRLFIFLMTLVIFLFASRTHVVPFISHFLAFYLSFTVFEVASLSKHFRTKDGEAS